MSPCQQIGIETKLKYGSRFCFTRELCIDYLVRPVANVARGFDTAQNVGTSDPMVVGQRTLNNHLHALFHSRKRLRDGFVCNLDSIDSDRFQTVLCQVLDIVLLVDGTSLPKKL